MGELAAIAGLATNIGGTVTEMIGAQYQGEAEHAAAVYNARATTMQAREAAAEARRKARLMRSENIVRVAKSGVRLEGSPLESLVENAYLAERDALNIERTGKAYDTLYRMQAKQAIVASRFRMASAAFSGIGSMMGGSSQGFAFGAGPGGGGGGGGGAGGAK